ncbi:NLR family member X1-like [Hemitrygon akajei]|uniref:NLR family member X1-like n=1 Tax=Hemitrygon akajei TaxID=2704970 RepID=UPI003BF972C6
MATDLSSAFSAFLSICDDHQLLRLTRFYMEQLEQAIEEGVEGLGLMLTGKDHFTGRMYHRVTELAEKGNRAGASRLLLDLVMEKGSGAQRMMWQSFVKLHHHLPELSRILNEIRERGDGQFAYMDAERGLSEVPAHLKDVEDEKRRLLKALRYLSESQNRGLAQAALESVEKLSFSGMTLTPTDCAVLSRVIGLCDTIKHLDVTACDIQCKGIQWLDPVLHKCQELQLGENKLGDSGVKLVSAALRNPECKIQQLLLINVGLTDSGAKNLVSSLGPNRSLKELDLQANSLTDQSVPALHHLIRTHPSLEWIHLWYNDFSKFNEMELRSLEGFRPGLNISL